MDVPLCSFVLAILDEFDQIAQEKWLHELHADTHRLTENEIHQLPLVNRENRLHQAVFGRSFSDPRLPSLVEPVNLMDHLVLLAEVPVVFQLDTVVLHGEPDHRIDPEEESP